MSISVKNINSKKVFIRGVPPLVDHEDIESLFGKYGPIECIKFWSSSTPKDTLTSVAYEFILKDIWSFQQFVAKKGYAGDLGIPADKLQNDEWLAGWISSQNSMEVYIEYQDYRDAGDARRALRKGQIKIDGIYLSVGVEK